MVETENSNIHREKIILEKNFNVVDFFKILNAEATEPLTITHLSSKNGTIGTNEENKLFYHLNRAENKTDIIEVTLKQGETEKKLEVELEVSSNFITINQNAINPNFFDTILTPLTFDNTNNNLETGLPSRLELFLEENTPALVGFFQNSSPNAADDQDNLTENATIFGNVLSNDQDLDGDTLSITNPGVTTLTHGVLGLSSDGTYIYISTDNKLAQGESAIETFTYTVTDNQGNFNTANLLITITGQNDDPDATGLVFMENGPDEALFLDLPNDDPLAPQYEILTKFGNLAATETGFKGLVGGKDIDQGDTLRFSISDAQQPNAGNVSIDTNTGEFIFHPGEDFQDLKVGETQTITFKYTVEDPHGGQDTEEVTLTIGAIDRSAETPSLTTDTTSVTRLLDDDFEDPTALTINQQSTSNFVSEIQGWQPTNSAAAIEVWNHGDQGKFAAPNNGQMWVELNWASYYPNASGITKDIQTEVGKFYVLSLEYAPRLGNDINYFLNDTSAYTGFELRVDGTKIGSYSENSSKEWQDLQWKTVSFIFEGKGGTETLELLSSATAFSIYGRGAYIDNLTLDEYTHAARSGEAIQLNAFIDTSLIDQDGSETLSLTIKHIPHQYQLYANDQLITLTNGEATLSENQLTNLELRPSDTTSFFGQLHLDIISTATEQTTGDTKSISESLNITILPGSTSNETPSEAVHTNTLIGGNEADNIIGDGPGSRDDSDDLIIGQGGDDILTGGGGKDEFVFYFDKHHDEGNNIITDFSKTNDRISINIDDLMPSDTNNVISALDALTTVQEQNGDLIIEFTQSQIGAIRLEGQANGYNSIQDLVNDQFDIQIHASAH